VPSQQPAWVAWRALIRNRCAGLAWTNTSSGDIITPPGRVSRRTNLRCTMSGELASTGLSIIIPAFNEERRLPKTLDCVGMYLKTQSLRAEILVVDDGSSDDTAGLAASYASKYPNLRVLSNEKNRGKGYSVRHGMLEARGEYALFTDADLSTPIDELGKLLAALRNKERCGNRVPRFEQKSDSRPPVKGSRTGGILFNYFVAGSWNRIFRHAVRLQGLPYGPARIIFKQQRMERFGFDPEILFLAKRYHLRVAEVPVRWSHDSGTKVNVARRNTNVV